MTYDSLEVCDAPVSCDGVDQVHSVLRLSCSDYSLSFDRISDSDPSFLGNCHSLQLLKKRDGLLCTIGSLYTFDGNDDLDQARLSVANRSQLTLHPDRPQDVLQAESKTNMLQQAFRV